MPLRNPFKKTGGAPGLEPAHGENDRPGSRSGSEPDFERAPIAGSTESTPPLGIKRGREEEPDEYKLCVVNDSGVYLPPSPPEKKGFWHRSHGSSTPSSHRQVLNDNEPFSISRESFDSYRRSFDISARSPVVQYDVTPPRKSLDSRAMRLSRSIANEKRVEREPPTAEELFEDVGLNDEPKPKRKGLFSRFGDSLDMNNSSGPTSNSMHSGFHFTSWKHGQSGQGAELRRIEKPRDAPEIKADN